MPSYSRKVQIPGKTAQELYEKVAEGIDYFMSKASVGKFDIERDPTKKEVRLKGSMFSATLSCAEAQVEIDAKLSLLAAPFKSKLDEGVTKWLSKTFNLTNLS
jgi:hypothetical protein